MKQSAGYLTVASEIWSWIYFVLYLMVFIFLCFILFKNACVFWHALKWGFFGVFYCRKVRSIGLRRWSPCTTTMKRGMIFQKKLLLLCSWCNCPKPFVWFYQDFLKTRILPENLKSPGKKVSADHHVREPSVGLSHLRETFVHWTCERVEG